MNDSVTIVIPAFNEEQDIAESIRVVTRLTQRCIKDFEIIVVNDGSTDTTADQISKEAKRNKHVRVITHEKNMGFGAAFRDAIRASRKKYISGFPADLDQSYQILPDLIRARNKADIVSSYVTNLSSRAWIRKVISLSFIHCMNFLLGLNLKYYTGYFICPVEILRDINLKANNTALLAEAKIKLIKRGYSFVEIPYKTSLRKHGSDKALTWKNIIRTLHFLATLFTDIYIVGAYVPRKEVKAVKTAR